MNRRNLKKNKQKNRQLHIITLEIRKVVIYKLVILPKLRKKQENWSFHLRNEFWQPTQDKNKNGSVMTQMEIKRSVYIEVMETQRNYVTFTQIKEGIVPLRKRGIKV